MIKQDVKFNDAFTGEEKNATLYFNMNEWEFTKFLAKYDNDLDIKNYLDKITASGSNLTAMDFIEDLILSSYGIRTESNDFVKTKDTTEAFKYSNAFAAFAYELFKSQDSLNNFVMNIVSPLDKNKLEEVKRQYKAQLAAKESSEN